MPLALSKQTRNALVDYADAQKNAYLAAQQFVAWANAHEAEIVAWPKNPDGTLEGYGVTLAQLVAVRSHAQAVVAAGDENPAAKALLAEVAN